MEQIDVEGLCINALVRDHSYTEAETLEQVDLYFNGVHDYRVSDATLVTCSDIERDVRAAEYKSK